MKLSQGADYGLVAVIYLAQKGEGRRVSVDEISKATDIPKEFLRKISQRLVKSGVIDSFKGKGGGVRLACSPERITISQVIEPLEEKKGLVRCLRGEYCPRSDECPASEVWRKIQEQFFKSLEKITIKHLIEISKAKDCNQKTKHSSMPCRTSGITKQGETLWQKEA